MPWCYKICIAELVYTCRDDLSENLGKTTARKSKQSTSGWRVSLKIAFAYSKFPNEAMAGVDIQEMVSCPPTDVWNFRRNPAALLICIVPMFYIMYLLWTSKRCDFLSTFHSFFLPSIVV